MKELAEILARSYVETAIERCGLRILGILYIVAIIHLII
jgi:hypothetical protein